MILVVQSMHQNPLNGYVLYKLQRLDCDVRCKRMIQSSAKVTFDGKCVLFFETYKSRDTSEDNEDYNNESNKERPGGGYGQSTYRISTYKWLAIC